MKNNGFARALAVCLALIMCCGVFAMPLSASSAGQGNVTAEELQSLLSASSYAEYDAKHDTAKGSAEVVIDARDLASYTENGTVYYYDGNTFYTLDAQSVRTDVSVDDLAVGFDVYDSVAALTTPADGKISWTFDVPSTGRYDIQIKYYPLGNSPSAIERVFYIDGKVPFAEARYISLSKNWKYDYVVSGNSVGFKTDLNGNDIKPMADVYQEWMVSYFQDANGFNEGPFAFYFDNKNGTQHTISLEASREAMAIAEIRLVPSEPLKTYDSYLSLYETNGYQAAGVGSYIKIEAETPYYVSDTSVYAANDRTSAVTSPNDASKQLLNVIGADSFNTIGQWAAYQFTVNKTGLYEISVRCMQDELAGMYTSRTLRLQGGIYGDNLEVPFIEAYRCRFNYDKSWQIVTLGDGTSNFQFYFEEGVTYMMSFDVSLGTLSSTISSVEASLNNINAAYLEILKLTGADPDEYRDYNFNRVMPSTIRTLYQEYKRLTEVANGLIALSGSNGSHVATLQKVAYLLQIMSTDESKIAGNLENLKSNVGSLGTWLNQSKQQSLTMDYIIVSGVSETTYTSTFNTAYPDVYRENATFFEAAGFEITAFFRSFFTDYNQMGVTNNTEAVAHVEVWLSSGRDQASIWRNQIDSSFTSQNGIAVDLKLITGGTLLPSILAKKGPDLSMSMGSDDAINYAIRSAVLPITEFVNATPGALDSFNEATITPLTMYGEIYGMPEAIGFPMMFYRKDILANLGIDVPVTWDDVLSCVPVFQSANMEMGMGAGFETLLYQAGGDRWQYEGTNYSGTKYADLMSDSTFSKYFDYMEVDYDSNLSLETFAFYCRFYTDYSFPVSYDASNRFRTGEMPIIFGDAVGTYNQLTVFATEIRGLWSFTKVPGTRHSDGTVSNLGLAGVTATVMVNGIRDKDASWEFLRWETSATVQAQYGNGMVSIIGPAAKYSSANLDSIYLMTWTTEERNNLLDQLDNLASIPCYPGSYIIGRYQNFAFLNAIDGKRPEDELQDYVKTINKEITRKRQEFDLPALEDGDTMDDAIDRYLRYLKTLPDSELTGYSEYVRNYVASYR